jgi:hypothetical protein
MRSLLIRARARRPSCTQRQPRCERRIRFARLPFRGMASTHRIQGCAITARYFCNFWMAASPASATMTVSNRGELKKES